MMQIRGIAWRFSVPTNKRSKPIAIENLPHVFAPLIELLRDIGWVMLLPLAAISILAMVQSWSHAEDDDEQDSDERPSLPLHHYHQKPR